MAKGEGQLGKGSYSFYLLSPLSFSLFSSFPHEYQTHEFFPYPPSFPDCNEEVSFEQQVPIPFPRLILQSDGVGAPAGSGWVIEEDVGGPFFQPKVPTAGRKRAFSLLTVAHPLIYKNGKNLDAPPPRIIPSSPFDSPPTPLFQATFLRKGGSGYDVHPSLPSKRTSTGRSPTLISSQSETSISFPVEGRAGGRAGEKWRGCEEGAISFPQFIFSLSCPYLPTSFYPTSPSLPDETDIPAVATFPLTNCPLSRSSTLFSHLRKGTGAGFLSLGRNLPHLGILF